MPKNESHAALIGLLVLFWIVFMISAAVGFGVRVGALVADRL